jgi:hypothetical protein
MHSMVHTSAVARSEFYPLTKEGVTSLARYSRTLPPGCQSFSFSQINLRRHTFWDEEEDDTVAFAISIIRPQKVQGEGMASDAFS